MLRVVFRRVQPDKVDRLRDWLQELERRAEVVETFRQESVRHEVAYLLEGEEGPVLVYAMEAEDFEQARAAFEASTLPIDTQHKAIMGEALGDAPAVEKLYECSAVDTR